MADKRMIGGVGALVLGAGLAGFGVLVHYGLSAEYVKDSALEGTLSGFTMGVDGIALVLVGAVALVAFMVSPRRGLRAAALLLPVGLVLGMFAVTPAALNEKLKVQFSATPECGFGGNEKGPGVCAARESERTSWTPIHRSACRGGASNRIQVR